MAKALQLKVSRKGATETFPLPPQGTVLIGRSESCDVCIPDGTVSRKHASIHVGRELMIEDLGSHNGTVLLVNAGGGGQAVKTGSSELVRLKTNSKRALPEGAMLQIGVAMLTVEAVASRGRAVTSSPAASGVVVADRGMQHLYELAERVADSDISVLLLGESGVGKDVLARFIHNSSPRADGRMTSLNCGALPEQLLESELFGHEEGAFTGAAKAKSGFFEVTDGGTLFLDEIGELSPALQVKLLRVLEDRVVTRVGGTNPRRINLRFIAATNRDLEREVASGTFREDLFYRLNGITLQIPALRERAADIVPLAEHFLAQFSSEQSRRPPALSDAAKAKLSRYSWPGNIRQLRNVIQRALLLAGNAAAIEPTHVMLPNTASAETTGAGAGGPLDPPTPEPRTLSPEDLRQRAGEVERQRIIDALEACGGNQTRAAEMLGLTRRALIGRLDKYGIPRPRKGRKS